MKDLYLVGAGGFGRVVLNMILDKQSRFGPQWNIKGFLDDSGSDALKNKECDYSVVGTIRDYMPKPNDALLMCVFEPVAKQKLVSMLKERGAVFESFIGPYAYVGRHNKIGEGVIIENGFRMSVNNTIGNFVTILASTFGHDVSIGDYCSIAGGCSILGNVKIGNGVFLGNGVQVAPNVEIGNNSRVDIGSVVIRNVKQGREVFGNPAKEIA